MAKRKTETQAEYLARQREYTRQRRLDPAVREQDREQKRKRRLDPAVREFVLYERAGGRPSIRE